MEELKNFRNSLNFTMSEFAKQLDVSKSLYEKVECRCEKT